MSNKIKIAMIGDNGVGKTSYLKRYSEGVFVTEHQVTQNSFSKKLTFDVRSNFLNGKVVVNCCENVSLAEVINVDAYMLMFDLTSRSSFEKIEKIYKELKDFLKDKHVILVGNKCESKNQVVTEKDINNMLLKYKTRDFVHMSRYFPIEHCPIEYCPISVKTCFNHEKPFLYLLRKVIGIDNLEIVSDE